MIILPSGLTRMVRLSLQKRLRQVRGSAPHTPRRCTDMIAALRKDGRLYIKLDDDDSYRCLDNNAIEIFLSPEQVKETVQILKNGKVI